MILKEDVTNEMETLEVKGMLSLAKLALQQCDIKQLLCSSKTTRTNRDLEQFLNTISEDFTENIEAQELPIDSKVVNDQAATDDVAISILKSDTETDILACSKVETADIFDETDGFDIFYENPLTYKHDHQELEVKDLIDFETVIDTVVSQNQLVSNDEDDQRSEDILGIKVTDLITETVWDYDICRGSSIALKNQDNVLESETQDKSKSRHSIVSAERTGVVIADNYDTCHAAEEFSSLSGNVVGECSNDIAAVAVRNMDALTEILNESDVKKGLRGDIGDNIAADKKLVTTSVVEDHEEHDLESNKRSPGISICKNMSKFGLENLHASEEPHRDCAEYDTSEIEQRNEDLVVDTDYSMEMKDAVEDIYEPVGELQDTDLNSSNIGTNKCDTNEIDQRTEDVVKDIDNALSLQETDFFDKCTPTNIIADQFADLDGKLTEVQEADSLFDMKEVIVDIYEPVGLDQVVDSASSMADSLKCDTTATEQRNKEEQLLENIDNLSENKKVDFDIYEPIGVSKITDLDSSMTDSACYIIAGNYEEAMDQKLEFEAEIVGMDDNDEMFESCLELSESTHVHEIGRVVCHSCPNFELVGETMTHMTKSECAAEGIDHLHDAQKHNKDSEIVATKLSECVTKLAGDSDDGLVKAKLKNVACVVQEGCHQQKEQKQKVCVTKDQICEMSSRCEPSSEVSSTYCNLQNPILEETENMGNKGIQNNIVSRTLSSNDDKKKKKKTIDGKNDDRSALRYHAHSPKVPKEPSVDTVKDEQTPKYSNVINTFFVPPGSTNGMDGSEVHKKDKAATNIEGDVDDDQQHQENLSKMISRELEINPLFLERRRKSLNEMEVYPKYQRIRKSKSVDFSSAALDDNTNDESDENLAASSRMIMRNSRPSIKCTKSYPEMQTTLCPRINVVIEEPSLSGSDNSILSEIDFSVSDHTDEFEYHPEVSDDEVAGILKTSEFLGGFQTVVRRRGSHDGKYDEVVKRRRSKSFDTANLGIGNVDFARYGISVGIRSPQGVVNSGNPIPQLCHSCNKTDLLPGIEDFLSSVLAKETLSPYAEEQRQYFLERLDIIKLPPSIPPRPQSLGVRLYPTTSTPPPSSSKRHSFECVEQDDFAAYQRELSRALVDSEPSSEHNEVKLYDDIELTEESICVTTDTKQQNEEESMYEIPQIKGGNLNDSGYEKAGDVSQLSKSVSCESLKVPPTTPGRPLPPPLPPRKDRAGSDGASRGSVSSILEDRTMDMTPKGSNITRDMSLASMLNDRTDCRSERSSEDLLDADDIDGLSCDSLDDASTRSKDIIIKLPKPVKKKSSQRHRLGQSMSSLREITQPFRLLEDVCLSGELHYKSKLSWSKKLVALTNGRLICYKYDRADTRPTLVILLVGYQATYSKKEGKKSYEILLAHDNFESYFFLSEFKEWAEMWCNYMNLVAEGKRPPGHYQHLARGPLIENSSIIDPISKSNNQLSTSNLSIASSDGFDSESGTGKLRKRDSSSVKTPRMGSFASKASQFFENLGKKSSVKKTLSNESDRSSKSDKPRPLSSATSQSSLCELISPMTPESGIVDAQTELKRQIKHQGYLDIFSSFNKRKWGKRWCMIHENNFECYRTQTSEVIELEFLLQNCVLHRAVKETKSELGLMLMENNREKITIEPLNWTELGSWLRVLMQETTTMVTPEGLEGYMDDTNPYHEAVEITRLSDPFPTSPSAVSPTTSADRTLTNTSTDHKRNRDSGNCSAESMDGRCESLDRNFTSSTNRRGTSPESDIQRTKAPNTGDIYAQVCKPKNTSSNRNGAKNKKANISDEMDPKLRSKSENDLENSLFLFDFNNDESRPVFQQQKSLIDEIMSQVNSQLQKAEEMDVDEGPSAAVEENAAPFTVYLTDDHQPEPSENLDVPKNYSELVTALSPIKHDEEVVNQNSTRHFLSSSVVEDQPQTADIIHSKDSVSAEDCVHDGDKITCKHKAENVSNSDINDKVMANHDNNTIKKDNLLEIGVDLKKCSSKSPSSVLPKEGLSEVSSQNGQEKGEGQVPSDRQTVVSVCVDEQVPATDALQELRKRLVQLKKERISIKDRKEKASSSVDKEFLEAEYRRLDRECQKVTDEIKYLEMSQNATIISGQKLDCIPEVADGVTAPPDVLVVETGSKADKLGDAVNEICVQKVDSLNELTANVKAVAVRGEIDNDIFGVDELGVMHEFDKILVELEKGARVDVTNGVDVDSKDLSSIEEEGTDSEASSKSGTGKCGCSSDVSADGKIDCELCRENVSIKELIDNIAEERDAIQGDSVEYSICASNVSNVGSDMIDTAGDVRDEMEAGANNGLTQLDVESSEAVLVEDADAAELSETNASLSHSSDNIVEHNGNDGSITESEIDKLEPNENHHKEFLTDQIASS